MWLTDRQQGRRVAREDEWTDGQTKGKKKTIGLILPCSWPPKLLVTFDKPEGQQLKQVNFIVFYSMKIKCNLVVLISHQIKFIIIIIRSSSLIILQLRLNRQKNTACISLFTNQRSILFCYPWTCILQTFMRTEFLGITINIPLKLNVACGKQTFVGQGIRCTMSIIIFVLTNITFGSQHR